MKTEAFKVTLHMVSSLDGFVARKDNSVSWFETTSDYEKGVEAENAEEFVKSIGCYVMGSRTYEHAVELSKNYGWVYGDVPTVVVSNRILRVDRKNVEIFSGDLDNLINDKLRPKYKSVWVVGGASLIKEFIKLKLADEIRMSILPIILGDGIPFFAHIGQEHLLKLKDARAYKNGMVELCYEVKK